jgi:hypothetical protein
MSKPKFSIRVTFEMIPYDSDIIAFVLKDESNN